MCRSARQVVATLSIGVLAMLFGVQSALGQVPQGTQTSILPSLTEAGEGLRIVATDGPGLRPTFTVAAKEGILLPIEASAPATERALAFVEHYGAAYGLRDRAQVRFLRHPERDALSFEHVRLQQMHQGVPVRGAEFIVHLKGARVVAANGHVLDDLPDDVTPSILPEHAVATAERVIEKNLPDEARGAIYSEPRLEIFNRRLFSEPGDHETRLAWFVEASGSALRQFIWIDARSGVLLLSFSQLPHAKVRSIHNGNYTKNLPGTLMRSEGGLATGDTDADLAYAYSGDSYDYFLSQHGRDGINGAGGPIISTVHHCPEGFTQGSPCPSYLNAFWNGTQLVYADGFSRADDVVAHEYVHGVTQYTADLFYYMQSGALNESFSDIFGETIDLLNGAGTDTSGVRWRLGEDLPTGAIRHMMSPNLFGQPAKMSDAGYFYCNNSGWTDPNGDSGGVHINSGIPNHAFALMADGGTYNSTTIAGIGLIKAGRVQYRALSVYLTSGATFTDNYYALVQSCSDLAGTDGITAQDCEQVSRALQSVEMFYPWACTGYTQAPPLCSTGTPRILFRETFETPNDEWTITGSGTGAWWYPVGGYAKGGRYTAYGADNSGVSDHRLTQLAAVSVPPRGRLHFDHSYEFENGLSAWDGGVLEYSSNGGTTWLDAGGLIDAGQTYNGTISNLWGNPLGGRSAFVRASHGYTGTRLNLAPLAGQSVMFRFRIGTDLTAGSLGWDVDNITIYDCEATPTGPFWINDALGGFGTLNIGTET
ncbi:MAG TPA: M4 family metallopeptidase, partial [Thermoanaerobaculia bacterium]